ncbi:deoxyribose-phosphate aldolase [Treponema phagedenis]|uniref:deoxyribose-phosphate aldolase n=1 Tax=Treponema phagedenis TaxID=162 RepID=UPI00159F8805|nr:deoxyribose-phosphate aldolase [Treponema phagedenis]NVP23590.1 deoxyribose-phosphate aldolase [Treponema phagedenis]QLC58423.1 deoxyribose-phosphate aldolase [Treponema phagedenis]
MKKKEIMSHVDHTLLSPVASWEEIEKLADEAIEYGAASICIPQSYVARVKDKYGDRVNICTVVGFPLGYNSSSSKLEEVRSALEDGANEIDMVINISHVKNQDYGKVEEEIKAIREACQDKVLKVIIETCYLTEEEKIQMCKIVSRAGADYIKTSTGFGPGGAKMEDILLFKDHLEGGVKIKASSGIRTLEDLIGFIQAGAERLGSSSAIKILEGDQGRGSY